MVLYSVSAGWTWLGVVSVAGAKFRFSNKARAKDTPGTLWAPLSILFREMPCKPAVVIVCLNG